MVRLWELGEKQVFLTTLSTTEKADEGLELVVA
jgi:hypothetical protein